MQSVAGYTAFPSHKFSFICLSTAGYVKGKSPADACAPSASSKKPATASKPHQHRSTLETWLEILAWIASSGRAMAFSLFSMDVLTLMKEISRDFSAHAAIVQGVEVVCGELACNCQVRDFKRCPSQRDSCLQLPGARLGLPLRADSCVHYVACKVEIKG